MLGAIVGDIVGSVYEFNNHRSKDFPLLSERSHFSDDTILAIATAHAQMTDWDYAAKYLSTVWQQHSSPQTTALQNCGLIPIYYLIDLRSIWECLNRTN